LATWIGLFRGINVGGRNIIQMAKLREIIEPLGCENARTYIQSGNLVFESKSKNSRAVTKRILDAVENEFDIRPNLLLVTAEEFLEAKSKNPFPKAVSQPKTLHLFFLETVPKSPDMNALKKLATSDEVFRLIGKVFYLHAKSGFARSKLAAATEKKLGVAATARNWATVEKISEMINVA